MVKIKLKLGHGPSSSNTLGETCKNTFAPWLFIKTTLIISLQFCLLKLIFFLVKIKPKSSDGPWSRIRDVLLPKKKKTMNSVYGQIYIISLNKLLAQDLNAHWDVGTQFLLWKWKNYLLIIQDEINILLILYENKN